jgi:hypothetical protein
VEQERTQTNREIHTRRDFDFTTDTFADDFRLFGYSNVTWQRALETLEIA